MKTIKPILALSAITLMSSSAVFALQAPLGTHGSLSSPNAFGGSGIPQNDVMYSTYNNDLTLALSAHERYVGPLLSDNNGTFYSHTGESAPGLSLWNFNFYIDANSLASYSFKLTYGTDSSSFSINPISAIGDNEPHGSLTTAGNSENLGFAFGIPISFNPNVADKYYFLLEAFSSTDANQVSPLAQTAINVDVSSVPDGGTSVALLGMALTVGAALRRKLA